MIASMTDDYSNLSPIGYQDLLDRLWVWLDQKYHKLHRIGVLGGEPFIQDDFYKLLDYIDQHPNPNLELSIVTNLIIKKDLLVKFVEQTNEFVRLKKIKRVDILASVECWGAEQEYIRYGFNCSQFEENFNYLLKQSTIRLSILSTVNALSINSMPKLAEKYLKWNQTREVDWQMHLVLPNDDHVLSPTAFDYRIFEQAIDQIAAMLPDQYSRQISLGISEKIKNHPNDIDKQQKMLHYINEVDRRRGLNWQQVFPWLKAELNVV
jgi:hypothetical protein